MIRWQAVAAVLGTAMFLLTGCSDRSDNSIDSGTTRIFVMASVSNSNIFEALEEPFWTEQLPAASNGQIEIDLRSSTESGLKGPEIARLLSAGALDVAYGDGTVSGDLREFEGLELAGVLTDLDSMHKAADAYKPVIDRHFNQRGIKLLGFFPYPEFAFYCRGQVSSLEELRGKKVRVYTQSMSDFVEAIGAVAVNIPFPDVVTALQTGVADCSITGTFSGNKAGWAEVTDSLFTLPVGGGLAFYGYSARSWNELDPEIREIIETEFARFENEAWELARSQTRMGINCNTGSGECINGNPADMSLYRPSAADIARAHEIGSEVILPRWAQRCGDRCLQDWVDSVGEATNIRLIDIQAGGR